jgi:hypothetical protein
MIYFLILMNNSKLRRDDKTQAVLVKVGKQVVNKM